VRKVDSEKRQIRRLAILEAAARCFARSGFRGATIADICAEAGISPGNLYYYFANKEAIVDAMARGALDDASARFGDMTQGADAVAELTDEVKRLSLTTDLPSQFLRFDILAEAGRNPAIAEIARGHNTALREMFAGYLRAAQAEGKVERGLDPTLTAAMLLSALGGLASLGLERDAIDLASAFDLFKTMVERLLAPNVPAKT
jgi:TetR/AcrR family transcriptional regulator, repressor for uid operon